MCGDDDDDYFTKMLIISYVEICSKPMAILLYDDFFFVCVCVFATFLLACHSEFLEGYYFSMMICMLCRVKKTKNLRSLPNSAGQGGRNTGRF